ADVELPATRSAGYSAAVMTAIHLMAWMPLFILFFFVVPRSKKIFADFGMKLPWITESIIDISDTMRDFFWFLPIIVAGAFVADAAILFLLRRDDRWRLLSWLPFLLLLVVPLVGCAIVWLGLELPMVELTEGLSR